MKEFKDTEFVIFDVETTGLSPANGDKIIEIAGLKIRDLKPVDRFHSLVDPLRDIAIDAFFVNGISAEMLKGAPVASQVLPRFLEFSRGACLVAHNIAFDLGFLKQELGFMDKQLPVDLQFLDTVRMARGLLPGLERYSLLALVYYFELAQEQKHRAMADVELTYQVFLRLLEIAQRKDIGQLEYLLRVFGNRKSFEEETLGQFVPVIQQAIAESQPLEMVYASAAREITSRKVTPQKLTGRGANMQLVGFCHSRNAERSFKLGRILRLYSV